MNRGVVILFHQLLGDQNRVFKVVAAPRHERDQHVSSKRQFAMIGARTVSNDLALGNALALLNDRFLVDTSVLVGPLEFCELIDVAAHFS